MLFYLYLYIYILCIYFLYLFIYFGNDATVRTVLIQFSIKLEIWTKNIFTKSETENVMFKIQRVYKIGFPHFTFVFTKEKKQLYFISTFRIKNVLFAFNS